MTLIHRIFQEVTDQDRRSGEFQVFIGHEFHHKDLRASLKRSLEQMQLHAYFADRYVTGQYILDKVCKKILVTRASVVDLSSGSPNVYFELGVAIGLNKPIFVVHKQASTVPSILESFVKVRFSSYDGLESALAREVPGWLADSIEHHLRFNTHCQFVNVLCPDRQRVAPKRRYLTIDQHELIDEDGRRGEHDFRMRVRTALDSLDFSSSFLDEVGIDDPFRLCNYCRWERGTNFVLCHLTQKTTPSGYLMLGLAVGIGLPTLLIVQRSKAVHGENSFELPRLLQGLDALEYEHLLGLEERLPDAVFQFVSGYQSRDEIGKVLFSPEKPRRMIGDNTGAESAESEPQSADKSSVETNLERSDFDIVEYEQDWSSGLEEQVHQALKLWHEASQRGSTLEHLEIVQQVMRAQDKVTARLATNQILLGCLDLLAENNRYGAEVLRKRFLDQKTAWLVANELNYSTTTIFKHQRLAMRQLAGIVINLEQRAQEQKEVNRSVSYHRCFLAHSNEDLDFTAMLHSDLLANGVSCWFAPTDLRIGEPMKERIDSVISSVDKVLVILSENSLKSEWIERELATAIEKEQRSGAPVIMPIRIDDAVFKSNNPIVSTIQRSRHIGDFRGWKDEETYQRALRRLLRDLIRNDASPVGLTDSQTMSSPGVSRSIDRQVARSIQLQELIAQGESETLEFKSTLRFNLHTLKPDELIELEIAKTLCAFMNSMGGTLIIGVDDNGNVVGIDNDISSLPPESEDGITRTLNKIVERYLRSSARPAVEIELVSLGEKTVCVVQVENSAEPVTVRVTGQDQYYQRIGEAVIQTDRTLTRVSASSTQPSSILIVTVTELETQSVLTAFSQSKSDSLKQWAIEKTSYYDLGTFGGTPVFMVKSTLGTDRALLGLRQAIQELRPQAVVLFGVAFGLRPYEQELGDIMIAKQIQYYEPRRLSLQEGQMQYDLRAGRTAPAARLLDRFRSGSRNWQGAHTHFGLIVSGEKLVIDSSFRDEILSREPEAIGGEMEGAGLYAVAMEANVDWISVQVIGNWADGNKIDATPLLATENAAQYLLYVLEQGGWDEARL